MEIYVSPDGNDGWSGRLPEPNKDGSDGPLATPGAARDAVRALKASALMREPVEVKFREGRYHVSEPLVFGPVDSGPVRYASFDGERAVIDGGRRITGWQETTVGGAAAWVAHLPSVAEGQWDFRQLFVNGERRSRPRFPREGFRRIADVPGSSRSAPLFSEGRVFRSAPGDVKPWKNLSDVEVVVLHYWIEERSTIRAFDEVTKTVTCERLFRMSLKDEKDGWAKYYVENVFEELGEPGDWYLDRPEGKLYYIPMPGESLDSTEVYAPVAHQLLLLKGEPEAGRHVEFLRFDGLSFEHTTWEHPTPDKAASSQSANLVPGVISLIGARNCSIENCTIAHVGSYGIELGDGCLGNRIVGNEITDTGAGGVKLNGATAEQNPLLRNGRNRVTDNHIHHGGRCSTAQWEF